MTNPNVFLPDSAETEELMNEMEETMAAIDIDALINNRLSPAEFEAEATQIRAAFELMLFDLHCVRVATVENKSTLQS